MNQQRPRHRRAAVVLALLALIVLSLGMIVVAVARYPALFLQPWCALPCGRAGLCVGRVHSRDSLLCTCPWSTMEQDSTHRAYALACFLEQSRS